VTPFDALEVINEIARRNNASLNGEGEAAPATWLTSTVFAASSISLPKVVDPPRPADQFGMALLADFGQAGGEGVEDLIALLAIDSASEATDQDRTEVLQLAFDAAWLDSVS